MRQKPFVYDQHNQQRFFFIVDFYCAENKLVIELDGKVHEYQRDLILKQLGLDTLRIANDELRNLEAVKKKILEKLG